MNGTNITLTPTEIEGMMTGGWKPEKKIRLNDELQAVCLDGETWRIEDLEQVVLGFVNPMNCRNSTEVLESFAEIADTGRSAYLTESVRDSAD